MYLTHRELESENIIVVVVVNVVIVVVVNVVIVVIILVVMTIEDCIRLVLAVSAAW